MKRSIKEHFDKHGYAILAIIPDKKIVESYEISTIFKDISNKIAYLCSCGYHAQILTSVNEDMIFVHAIDPNRQGEDVMSQLLPNFKDFVAEEIAKFIEIKSEKLRGDENPYYLLDQIRQQINDGTWKNYSEVQLKDIYK